MVKMDQQEQEQEQEQEQAQAHGQGQDHDQEQASSEKDNKQHGQVINETVQVPRIRKTRESPLKPMREFLNSGEQMFVTLEEAVYRQLHSLLNQTRASVSEEHQRTRKAFSSCPLESDLDLTAALSRQEPLVLSLALIFGTTLLMPKEQYMIHIGPLEPQQPASTVSADIARSALHNVELGKERELKIQSKSLERQLERRLLQDLLGVQILETPHDETSSPSSFPAQQERHYLDANQSSLAKCKVLLFMKAKSGLVFDGMLPKQMLDLHEDFSPEFMSNIPITKSKSEIPCEGPQNPTKKKRWPIHHIRIMGCKPESSPSSVQGDSDEMWYQVGPGLPMVPKMI
ncbi:hypothetical protein BGZ94_005278 [Podila epigama]|nr:hypothetical protein BGZ94_005278 [Podila epigama]